jgi:hypothetical protein
VRIFVAGPMRHLPGFNFDAFDAAAAALRGIGHEAFNPAEEDRLGGFDPVGCSGDENLAELGFDMRAAFARNMDYLCRRADAVALLDGWHRSRGVRAELAAASVLGVPAYPVWAILDGEF